MGDVAESAHAQVSQASSSSAHALNSTPRVRFSMDRRAEKNPAAAHLTSDCYDDILASGSTCQSESLKHDCENMESWPDLSAVVESAHRGEISPDARVMGSHPAVGRRPPDKFDAQVPISSTAVEA